MDAQEKMKFLEKKISEELLINPTKFISISIADFVDYDENKHISPEFAPVIFSQKDQIKILSLFKEREFIDFLGFEKGYSHFLVSDINKLRTYVGNIKSNVDLEEISFSTNNAYLTVEKNRGFIKLYKNGTKIIIGGIKTRKFRLMKVLMEPKDAISAPKKINMIFEQIRLPKDNSNPILQNSITEQEAKLTIINNTIKEIQKIKPLQGKIKFDFTDNKKMLRILFL